MSKLSKKNYYIKYSAIFLLLSLFLYYFFISQDRTLVNYGGDGFRQYYRAMLYMGDYFREILNNIFIKHQFIIPQWDFVIGEGNDILWTFHYYGLNDPINLLTVFFNENNMFIFYDLSVFLRMFISGIAFSEFCFYLNKKDEFAVLTGATIFVFSSYVISCVCGHIYFINSFIYLPLVLLGIEHLIKENKSLLLVVSVFFSSICNIYFFYMIVLTTIVYVIIRVLYLQNSIKEKISIVLRITLYSFIGVLISAVVFLPVAYSMLSNSRLSSNITLDLLYGKQFYLDLLSSFVYRDDYYGGYTIFALFSIVLLLAKKHNKQLLIFLLIAIVFLSFPFFGYAYNAFTYSTNRWYFALNLLISYMMVETFDEYTININKNKIKLIISLIVYFAVCIFINKVELKTYILFFILGLIYIVLSCLIPRKIIVKILPVCFIAMFLCVYIFFKYSPIYWDYAKNGTDIPILLNIKNEEHSVFESIDDDSFYRYSGNNITTNTDVNGTKSSTGYYWSVANNDVIEFRKLIGISDKNNHHYYNYDEDYILNSLASVKYFIDDDGNIPYGYNFYKNINGYDVYKATDSLPLVYTYNSYISEDVWRNSDLITKRELLAKSVVINPDNHISINENKASTTNEDISYTFTNNNGVEINNNSLKATIENASIDLLVNSEMEGEYYFILNNLECENSALIQIILPNESIKYIIYKTDEDLDSARHHDFAIRLGNFDGINEKITIVLDNGKEYKYDDIKIMCLRLEEITDNLNNLRKEEAEINLTENCINVNVELNERKVVVFSIPYADGWNAYIDGKRADILKANIMYMGLEVENGKHNIQLKYSTPLLKEGACCSTIGLVAYIITILIKKKNENEL